MDAHTYHQVYNGYYAYMYKCIYCIRMYTDTYTLIHMLTSHTYQHQVYHGYYLQAGAEVKTEAKEPPPLPLAQALAMAGGVHGQVVYIYTCIYIIHTYMYKHTIWNVTYQMQSSWFSLQSVL